MNEHVVSTNLIERAMLTKGEIRSHTEGRHGFSSGWPLVDVQLAKALWAVVDWMEEEGDTVTGDFIRPRRHIIQQLETFGVVRPRL